MALTQSTQFTLATTLFSVLSFLLGIFADLKKPSHGTPIKGKDMVICQFPHDPTVALGTLSTLAAACYMGIKDFSVFFPLQWQVRPKEGPLRLSTS